MSNINITTPAGITPGSTVITGGTDKRVLFDDAGVVGEDAGLTYDKTTGNLSVGRVTNTGNLNLGAGGADIMGLTSGGNINLTPSTGDITIFPTLRFVQYSNAGPTYFVMAGGGNNSTGNNGSSCSFLWVGRDATGVGANTKQFFFVAETGVFALGTDASSANPGLKPSGPILQYRFGDDSGFTYMQWGGEARVSSQFDKTNTVLADVTGLSVNVKAGRTYSFRAYLHVSPDNVGGHKYAIGGSCTATAIIYQVNSVNNSTNANIINSRQTTLGGSVGVVSGTADYTEITGIITVNAAGTLTVQFAQNVANGTSSVLVGSFMIVHDMP